MGLGLSGKGIIFSPDFIDIDECLRILRICRQYFSAIKIGNIYLYKYGIGVVKRIKQEFGMPVICDFKLMDIPDVAEEILRIGIENGIDGAMVWGLAGEETITRCIYSFPETMIFLLTEYTHTAEAISAEFGNVTARMAVEYKAFGIQAPATRPERILELRSIIGDNVRIISCGVGHQGTPYGNAVKSGADFEIIGRSIYKSRDPVSEAKRAFNAIHVI